MNVKVEVKQEDSWRRVLSIEVSAEDAAREYEKVARKVGKKLRIPGFRKGKAPLSVVRKSFKAELDQEFLETIVPKALGQALDETGLDPVTEPKFEELSFGEERPLSFKADFECRPDIEVKDYKGIAAEKQIPEVTEEHVDNVLEDFRKSRPDLEDVERPAIEGDVLLLDYQAVDDNGKPIANRRVKDYVLELGKGQVVEAFEESLKGVEPGAVRQADVPYPADYHDSVLAGSTAHYKIKVKNIQEKRFRELSDELVAEHTDLTTVAELRERVVADLAEQADRAGVERLEHVLLEKVVDANPFDSPAALVDGILEDLVARQRYEAQQQGEDPDSIDADKIQSEHRDGAARQVRRMLILDQIARHEGLRAEETELRRRVEEMAKLRGVSRNKLVQSLGGDRFLRRVSREMRDKKVLAFLVENAEIDEKTVSAQPSEQT